MDDYKFYMIRYGEADASWKDLESDFPGLRYKECTGLNSYGDITSTYIETYPETSKADVFTSDNPAYSQTIIKITFLFYDESGSSTNTESYAKANKSYHDFVEFVSKDKIAYRDTARRRKVLMTLKSAPEPKSDVIKGEPYIIGEFVFDNVYGCSFGYDEAFPNE